MNKQELDRLYEAVKKVSDYAYAPYSHFHVGAALLMADGNIVTGANIENASYGLSNCAERSALFSAYSLGYHKEDIKGLMVIGPTSGPVSPCGACRQVISELMNSDIEVVMTNWERKQQIVTVKDLLPFHFSKDVLNES